MTYAIYSEWERDEDIRQDLFVPSVTMGTKILPPTVWIKELFAGKGRRKWNPVPNPTYHPSTDQTTEMSEIIKHEINQFEGISNWMTSVIADPQWTLRVAYPVLITTSDLLSLSENSKIMPPDLNERINALRAIRGLPALPGSGVR
jgi:hypothetical protein